ncbi:alpha-(1,3)-fucosyltransferase 7-like isoform X1 [Portunus trituberculatus]|uniref:alpha-(1,3)-fucosyltransferase 7-like isoform X1 n=2 Tax=Portunus trituberculatus TaxID=210409 RepID=UPI001E1CD322|nr:alpha-(1,3)-fucosyltransferase 7-like isoform X1 [Portunus trituberculatus]
MVVEKFTEASAVRQRMMNVWRAARVMRLHWLLILSASVLLLFNVLLSTQRRRLPQQQQQQLTSSAEVRGPWRTFKGQLPDKAPLVQSELSSGVREEENSAREVLDVEGAEARQGHNPDVDAANEVNSVEPDTSVGMQLPTGNWRNLTVEEISHMSVLGRRMFLGDQAGTVRKNKTFTILVWKHGKRLERRFLKQYGSVMMEPFRDCSAQNCRLTYEDAAVADADAILFHLHQTKGPQSLPNRTRLDQRWIWLTDESSYNTFLVGKERRLEAYNGLFNWSMSYRMDNDVPVPYGRTLPLTPAEAAAHKPVDYFTLKPKLVAVMGSNCGGRNKRWGYIKELQKHMTVDTYGGCGTLKCPGHFIKDCPILGDYKFYLAFENSNCKEYITEKVWWNALEKGAVPVVMGTKVEDYRRVLPPHSFLHVDDFPTPQSLAQRLMYLGSNKTEYNKFQAWRSQFKVVNEHGYFQTPVFHYCRICEALNYNSQGTKVYNDLENYWGKSKYCYPFEWEQKLKAYSSTTSKSKT